MDDKLRSDPLLLCLVTLTKIDKKPASAEALIEGLPFDPNDEKKRLFSIKSSNSNFSRAAGRAGFSSTLQQRPLSSIPAVVLPVILLLKNDAACVLTKILPEQGKAVIIIPSIDDEPMEISMEKLEEDYLGYVFFLKRKYEGFGQDKLVNKDKRKGNKNWFFGTLYKFKDIYIRVVVATLFINVFVIAGPLFTMNVYDRVIPHNAIETLWVLAIGIGLIYGFDLILKFLRTILLERAAKKSDIILSSMLFEHAMNIKMVARPRSVGAFASNIRDFDGIRSFFASTALTAFIELPFSIIFLIVIYTINPILLTLPLTVILFLFIFTIPMKNSIQKIVDSTHEATGRRNSILVESLANLETIKAFNASSTIQWHWEESTGDIASKSLRSRIRFSSLSTISAFLTQLCSVLVIVVGVYLIKNGELTMGALIAVNILATRSIAPWTQAASLLTNYQQMKTGLQSLNELMEKEEERPENKRFIRRPEFKGDIEFKNVDFSYPDEERKALKNVSFKIKPGERIGIIGQVGSGKSTLSSLLMGFYDAESGSVFIDGLDIKQLDPVDLRQNYSYVPQEVTLFSGTVRDNITLKSPHATDAEIVKSANFGVVNPLTDRHPLGMDLQVGERGYNISGGQRQSIALARAFVEESPIVLLDEPTNSMDYNTEVKVIENLREGTKGKTTIIITHKPSILAIVDRLLVMDDGALVMDGPKSEVLAKLGGKG
ncbi:type I secretion system permease/ATPase [Desulfotalea psychrophila]|uniref:Related to toxin secretion ATP-binding protein n=1 Tax=Desulfotalea psychrophila (strain LSv54 / DSM 12343) TaxID=177439 RepID=Q6AQY2_DESPS|nr:type I secretion system permease/ATPase [Desulfotalea psychrophila]CAG35242.1 related to toxin secretion ATP-binding protein [Desulfotalea psychrophila LSv54]